MRTKRIKQLFLTILATTMLCSVAVPAYAAESTGTQLVADENASATEQTKTVTKKNGVVKGSDGKLRYYKNGKVNKKYNSIAKYGKKWYKFKNGVVDKKYTGVAKRTENGKYYYIKKGKLDKKYTGVAKYPKNKKWYRIKKGRVDFKYTGIAKRPETGKWYYIKKGKWVKYTGIVKYPKNNKSYYVKKGIVDFNYSGTVKDKATGKKYTVKQGKATAKKASGTASKSDTKLTAAQKKCTHYHGFSLVKIDGEYLSRCDDCGMYIYEEKEYSTVPNHIHKWGKFKYGAWVFEYCTKCDKFKTIDIEYMLETMRQDQINWWKDNRGLDDEYYVKYVKPWVKDTKTFMGYDAHSNIHSYDSDDKSKQFLYHYVDGKLVKTKYTEAQRLAKSRELKKTYKACSKEFDKRMGSHWYCFQHLFNKDGTVNTKVAAVSDDKSYGYVD